MCLCPVPVPGFPISTLLVRVHIGYWTSARSQSMPASSFARVRRESTRRATRLRRSRTGGTSFRGGFGYRRNAAMRQSPGGQVGPQRAPGFQSPFSSVRFCGSGRTARRPCRVLFLCCGLFTSGEQSRFPIIGLRVLEVSYLQKAPPRRPGKPAKSRFSIAFAFPLKT